MFNEPVHHTGGAFQSSGPSLTPAAAAARSNPDTNHRPAPPGRGTGLFVHSAVDDAGLSPEAFRVLAHIARRAGDTGAWASVSSMAETCRMGKKRTEAALRELLARGAITRLSRPGRTSVYRLTAPEEWNPPPIRTQVQNEPASDLTLHPPPNRLHHPPPKQTHEGNPPRVSHKVLPSVPPVPVSDDHSSSTAPDPNAVTAEEIFAAYPRPAGRKAALQAIRQAMAAPPAGMTRGPWSRELLERTQHYRRRRTGEPEQYTPYAATWFHQERYNDPPHTWAPPRTAPALQHKPRPMRNTI